MDKYGRFPEKSESYPFDSLSDWNSWQKGWTKNRTASYLADEKASETLLYDKGLTLLTGKGLVPLKRQAHGDLKLRKDRLEFIPDKGDALKFPLGDLEAPSMFKQQRFEFYYQDVL